MLEWWSYVRTRGGENGAQNELGVTGKVLIGTGDAYLPWAARECCACVFRAAVHGRCMAYTRAKQIMTRAT